MRFLRILVVILVVVGFFYVRERHRRVQSDPTQTQPASIAGTYLMDQAVSGPRLALRFIDDHRVQMLADGSPLGKNDGMCTYLRNGNTLELTHACGVWHLELSGDMLCQRESGFRFRHVR